jgi:hypothetical protein
MKNAFFFLLAVIRFLSPLLFLFLGFFLNERRESVNSLMAFFHHWMMVNRRNDEERWWVVLWVVIDGTPLLHLPERWVGLTLFFFSFFSVYIASLFLFDLILMNIKNNWFDWRHWKDNDSNACKYNSGISR